MSSDLRTLVEQEVELTHSELEDCFKQTHRILQTEYSRFAPGWVEYGHQVNKAVMSKVRAIIAAHEAKQATAPAVPQGWKLVPVEPTDAMVDAAHHAGWSRIDIYSAMLAAAPATAPAQDEPFGYFRAEPFGWTDCAKDDEGAIALYERPQEVGLTASQFDMICQAIDKADTVTMEGDYMLDSDDCIAVVRVMQSLFDIAALRAKGGK